MFYRPRQLSRLAGVSTDTLRHYERKGVLPRAERSANGYREYPAAALERVRLVRRAIAISFTLDELSRFLTQRDRGGAPCRKVRALAAGKLETIERQLVEMAAVRDDLRAALTNWDATLARTPRGRQARLLDALALTPVRSRPLLRPPLIKGKRS